MAISAETQLGAHGLSLPGAQNPRDTHERGSDSAPEHHSVSARYVVEPVHRAFCHRGAVRGGAATSALAEGLCLPALRGASALELRDRRARLLAMRMQSGADDGALGDAVSRLKVGADPVVPSHLSGHAEQEQHLGALAQAAFGRVLPHGVAGQAHKLLAAMVERESMRRLCGVVLAR